MEILETTRIDDIDTMAAAWGIAPGQWDAIVVGDGAGSGWNMPIGWAGVIVDRAERARRAFHGGMDCGTIEIAEMMPYLQATMWYVQHRREARRGMRRRTSTAPARVHIVSDHQTIERTGKALVRGDKTLGDLRANRPLWAALVGMEREGLVLTFHWIPRATAALNCWCDGMATLCFRAMKTLALPTMEGVPVAIHECNADHAGGTLLHQVARRRDAQRRRSRGADDRDCPGRGDG